MPEKKLLRTGDGSFTLACEAINETYHSRHGALQESRYVYLQKGLAYWHQQNPSATHCNIFEMGFGTGLNALLAAQYGLQNQFFITLESIENDPLEATLQERLGLYQFFVDHFKKEDVLRFLSEEWNHVMEPFSSFKLCKRTIDYFEWKPSFGIDLIFYDAFGSHAQSEMWEKTALERCVKGLRPGGVWVSYCAKGSVRRALGELGLQVERLEGPPGKREMIRAVK